MEYGLAEPCSNHVQDRKSTRLNSSHSQISYAVFCLKKKIVKLSYDSYIIKTHENVTVSMLTIIFSESHHLLFLFLFLYSSFYFFFFFFFNDTATTEIYTLSTRRSSDLCNPITQMITYMSYSQGHDSL